MRRAFYKESEVFWIVQSRGTLIKLGALRSIHWRCSVRKGILRNFANFTGKDLCQSLFFIEIETLAQVVSCKCCEISKNTFFTVHRLATVSMPFKNLSFWVGYWHVLGYNVGGQTQSTQTKWAAKLGVLVKIYIFSWGNMVFLWGLCFLPEKMTLFFSYP